MSTARAYVDGFNLYYGALKGTDYKWLDVHRWAAALMPGYTMRKVAYCTARVVNRADDPSASTRQDAYLRALSTRDHVEILEGNFSVRPKMARRLPRTRCTCCNGSDHACDCCRGPLVRIEKTEEKGSDVNLAVSLVRDAVVGYMDAALIVTGDSDIQGAVDIVRSMGVRAIIADPRNGGSLNGDERRTVRGRALAAAQLPDAVMGPDGHTITKPARW